MTVIRGAYNATYNSLSIGNTEVGFRKSYSYQGRDINFDAVGATPVDSIFDGLTLNIDFVCMEYDAAAIDILRWPFHATIGTLAPAGLSMWQLAKPLVLTSCTTGVNPQTITFYKAILAPGYDLELEYSHRERPVPLRMMIFPVKDGATGSLPDGCNDIVYFTETLWP